jgi:flagellar basal body-associated protein FliL
MEYTEEKPKKSLALYIIIVVLIIAVVAVYFIFFSQSGGLGGLFGSGIKDTSLVPDSLKKDFTGGIVNLKFDPTAILDNSIYQSLKSYAEPVEIKVTPGRPNPFIPF